MDSLTERLVLHPFSGEEAQRVVDETPSASDAWATDYPFADERDPLRSFAQRLGGASDSHPFTMYRIDELATGLAIGGLGFFYEPDDAGITELGYGLVASARGLGYATEALRCAVGIARRGGAKKIVAYTLVENIASQRVMTKAGFSETSRANGLVYYEIDL
jgi:RimJ/RimL family protein N-acetyltransferase